MYTAIELSKYVIDKCVHSGNAISNFHLQKTLYYIQLCFIRMFDKVAFRDVFEAWQYGPVIPLIYDKYKFFGCGPICQLFPTISDIFWNEEEKQLIDDVIEVCSSMDPWDLVDSVCMQGGPWDKAQKKRECSEIALTEMYKYAKMN